MRFGQKAIYHFDNEESIGIDEVPIGRLLIVDSYNGNTKIFTTIDDVALSSTTTIREAFLNNSIQEAHQEEISILTSLGTIDLKKGSYFVISLAGNIEFTIENSGTGAVTDEFILQIHNGGNYAVIWPDNIFWNITAVPDLTEDGIDVIGFYSLDNGETWMGMVMGMDFGLV